jgi:ribosomal protein S18 acetylase RimI-like enzyme
MPLGVGWARGDSESAGVGIEVVASLDDVADWLFSIVLDRAIEICVKSGLHDVHVDIGVYRADERQQARARSFGFVPATSFHRMRVDHDGASPAFAASGGVVVRTGPGDEAFRRDAHAVLNASFVDHFGFVPRSFEQWHERIEASATHDWSQLLVAYVDSEPVAMLQGNNAFVEDEGCGYVSHVGVLPSARGRGLARLLLLRAFSDDAQRGREGTLLHVDTNNVTPALGLYLAVGMRAVLVVDVWRRPVVS